MSCKVPCLSAISTSTYSELAAERVQWRLLVGTRSEMSGRADNTDSRSQSVGARADYECRDQNLPTEKALRTEVWIGSEKPPIIFSICSMSRRRVWVASMAYMQGAKRLAAEIAVFVRVILLTPAYLLYMKGKQNVVLFGNGGKLSLEDIILSIMAPWLAAVGVLVPADEMFGRVAVQRNRLAWFG